MHPALNDVSTFVLGLVLASLVHEAGHAACAWALGFEPRVISLGVGPTVLRLKAARATIAIRMLPIGGSVLTLPWRERPRWHRCLFVASGAVANLAALWMFSALAGLFSGGSTLLTTLAGIQGAFALINLLPLPLKVDGVSIGSDGLQLVQNLFGNSQNHFQMAWEPLASRVAPGWQCSGFSRHAQEILFQAGRQDKFKECWARREACVALKACLGATDTAKMEELLVLCLLSELATLYRDTGTTLEELDSWSAKLLAMSDCPGNRVTRGGALVALGRMAEAEAILKPLADQTIDWLDQVFCRAHLAQVAYAGGDHPSARQWMADAHSVIAEGRSSSLAPLLAHMCPELAASAKAYPFRPGMTRR